MRKLMAVTSIAFAFLLFSWYMSRTGTAWADGTETLGPPSGITVERGSGIAVGGTGLFSQPGTFTVSVPEGATVKQVLLYWEGQSVESGPGDDTLVINGNEVEGRLIGGPTRFFPDAYSSSFRADITGLDLVDAGTSALTVEGLSFSRRNNGAGVVVIYEEEGRTSEVMLRDGNDLAFKAFAGSLRTTVPQTFTFPAASESRTARFAAMAGSVAMNRPNAVAITVDGSTTKRVNLLGSFEGEEWDAIAIPVDIPAGVTSVTIELLSEANGTGRRPASLAWVVGGLSVPTAAPAPQDISVSIVKTNDADGDGAFSDDETAPAAAAAVPFRIVVSNPSNVPVVIERLRDTFGSTSLDLLTGDVLSGSATVTANTCGALAGAVIRPNSSTLATGEPASCAFTLASYAPPAGQSLLDTAAVRVSEQGNASNTAGAEDSSTVRSTTTPEPDKPAITLTKDATIARDHRGLKAVTFDEEDGDEETVTYVFKVTNTGDVPLTDVTLSDNVLGDIPLSKTTLQPGESATGTATYEVTRRDAAAGVIDNIATVTGVAPDGTRVEARDPEQVHVVKPPVPPTRPEEPKGRVDRPKERKERAKLPETGAGIGAAGGLGGGALLAGLIFLGLGAAEEKRSRREPRSRDD